MVLITAAPMVGCLSPCRSNHYPCRPAFPSSWLVYCSPPLQVTLTVKGRRDADLALLVAADQDPYVRWDAVQELGLRALLKVGLQS